MALLIDANTERVSVADASSIESLSEGTILQWVKLASTGVASRFLSKSDGANDRLDWSRNNTLGLFVRQRVTNPQTYTVTWANFAAYALDIYLYIAATWDLNDISNARVLIGNLTTLAAEPSAYDDKQQGSGSIIGDAGGSLVVGNRLADDRPANAEIAHVSVYNRALTVSEIQAQQFRRRPVSGCVMFHELGYNGTGTQPDWSGSGNNGTVTGATVADHVPIPFRRHRAIVSPYQALIDETIWQLPPLTTPELGDLLVAVDDPSGTPSTKKLALSALATLATTNVVVQVKTVGSGTYTPTSGMKKVLGIAVGSGGGGAGGINTDSAGSGGGGGGTVIRLMTAADIGASKAYVVGAGGAATSNGNATTLDTAGALMNAGGGQAGVAGATFSVIGVTTAGGAGGTAANGDLNIPGGAGRRGVIYSGTDGKGGPGGRSAFGFGGASGGTNVAGNVGQAYGAGGSGGHASATADRAGGAGADGILYLIEFIG